jgi:DNA-binding transcriptional regulator PaaX
MAELRRGPPTQEDKLLQAWAGREDEKLGFEEIILFAKKKGFKQRTTINYLNRLVRDGKIKKIVDVNRRTTYALLDKRAFLLTGIQEALNKLTTDELEWINVFLLILILTKKQSKDKDTNAFNLAVLRLMDVLDAQASLEQTARELGYRGPG